MRSPVSVAAKGKWVSILTNENIGGIKKSYLDGKHHPCPATGEGEDRFRFSDKNGTGSFFCACSNGKGDGFDLLKCCKGMEFAEAAAEIEKVVGTIEAVSKPTRTEASILGDLKAIKRTLQPERNVVEKYLRNRGIDFSAIPSSLRQGYLSYALKSSGVYDKMHAMVSLVKDPAGKVVTFHITYLTPDGIKADIKRAKVMATPAGEVRGAAVRLADPVDGVMAVGEGIESSASAMQLFRIPTWATLSTTGMQNWKWPPGLKKLIVFADNDKNFAGHAAAYTLAFHASTAKEHPEAVEVWMPLGADDWSDVLRDPELTELNFNHYRDRITWA